MLYYLNDYMWSQEFIIEGVKKESLQVFIPKFQNTYEEEKQSRREGKGTEEAEEEREMGTCSVDKRPGQLLLFPSGSYINKKNYIN